jgi:hypothetical protein
MKAYKKYIAAPQRANETSQNPACPPAIGEQGPSLGYRCIFPSAKGGVLAAVS